MENNSLGEEKKRIVNNEANTGTVIQKQTFIEERMEEIKGAP